MNRSENIKAAIDIRAAFQGEAEAVPKQEKPSQSPITLRVTDEERERLKSLAAGMSVSAYIRKCIFAGDATRRKRRSHMPVKDQEAMARALALLGASRIANNLNQLAHQANIGSLIMDENTCAQIDETYAHCVWSRIDAAKMKAINLPHFKLKLTELSRQIYLEQGWDMPRGLEDFADRDPLNYSQAEAQQAKRAKRDAPALKAMFQKCWTGSDSRAAFAHALKEQGFALARGDRRGFVAVDAAGEVCAVARWVGVKTKEVRARLGDLDDLPNVEEAIAILSRSFDVENFEVQQQAAAQSERRKELLEQKRLSLVAEQRGERDALRDMQRTRLAVEATAHAENLPTGLKAAWAKMTGAYQRLYADNEVQINGALQRDRREQQALIQRHLKARRALQHEFEQLEYYRELNAKSALREIGARLPDMGFTPEPVPLRPEYDSAQPLIIQPDEDALSIAEKVARDPAHILEVIADKKEAVTRADILRALVQYVPDPAKLRIAADAALRSPDLVEVKAGSEPRYSTQGFLSIKATLTANARTMTTTSAVSVSRNHIDAAIAKENAALQRSAGANLSAEQETAIRHVLTSGQLSCVIGLAGAGKSTMLSAARHAIWLTGVAPMRLTSTGSKALSAPPLMHLRPSPSWRRIMWRMWN